MNIEEKITLPIIRQNLDIFETSAAEDGSKQWLLYDPIQSKYFTIGYDAFELLSVWENNLEINDFIVKLSNNNYEIDVDGINSFIQFLQNNNLTVIENSTDIKRLLNFNKSKEKNIFKWLIHNYLFIRIPIFKPDNWLNKNLHFFNIFYTTFWSNIVLILGTLGIFLTFRVWDDFTSSFLYFFSKEGMFYYFISLVFVKSTHELGHAITAKRHGCKIPSIGVAFLVLFPVMYTDTTDSWKLKSKYKRLNIVLAGMKVELYLALIATFVWSFLPDGIVRSVVFIIATTSWITSLLVNISPFLRFDGYYALSDITNSKNLQPRSFALTKWFMRKNILGIKDKIPEELPRHKKYFFIIYAFLTWIYRFFLFLGIAFLVYNFAFKVLGIILFLVEIVWFILLPVYKELLIWWKIRARLSINKNTIFSSTLFILLIFMIFVPWKTHISMPAVIEAENLVDIYAPKPSQIEKIFLKNGSFIHKNELLISLVSPQLNHEIYTIEKEIELIELELKKLAGSHDILDQHFIYEESLIQKQNELESLNKIKNSLQIYATIDGIAYFNDDYYPRQWLGTKDAILSIYDPSSLKITSFCPEKNIKDIVLYNKASFITDIFEYPKIDAKIIKISYASSPYITHPELSSKYGGQIAIREDNNKLHSEKAYYKVDANITELSVPIYIKTRGVLLTEVKYYSLVQNIFNTVLTSLLKESSF